MRAWLAVALLSLLAAGCVTPASLTPSASTGGTTSVFERGELPFVRDDAWSRVLAPGGLAILDPLSEFVAVELPLDQLGSAVDGSASVHMGIFLPDVPAGTKVPVIADIGPYYGDGDVDALTPAKRLGEFLIENFVPHGYAVAQVSVFGTGLSTHCMDLMGPAEQAGVDAAVTWLATQEWSNGNVGLIGRSYDGSTPWEAAMFGNPALKTIVPISGLVGAHELMWRNGSSEFRGPIMHNVVYGAFGVDEDPQDVYNACRDYALGPAEGVAAYATGSQVAIGPNTYWSDRSFLPRALESYQGSVYFIHGLQDWNVDPHMIAPAYQQLQAAGIETKGLFGQWAHMYPDRAEEHQDLPAGRGAEAYPASVRLDWAQDLLEWFDHYLKGANAKPALHVEIQDNRGAWRVEDTFPPLDATWREMPLGDAAKRHDGADLVRPDMGETMLVFDLGVLSDERDVRISGLPQLHVAATPLGAGGQLYALLEDTETGTHLGHAIMDLRYANGGSEMTPVVPGMPLVARLELEPLDVVVPAGRAVTLKLAYTGEDYLPPLTGGAVMVDPAGTVLRFPIIERAESVFFTPPAPTGAPTGETPGFS